MPDFHILVMDGGNEISMSEIDASEAIKADPKRYSYAMVDVRDALKNETTTMRKTVALGFASAHPERFTVLENKSVASPKASEPKK